MECGKFITYKITSAIDKSVAIDKIVIYDKKEYTHKFRFCLRFNRSHILFYM